MQGKGLLLRSAELGVRATARFVPATLLRRFYDFAFGGLSVAVCLHRVQARVRRDNPIPEMSLSPATLDRFLALVGRKAVEDGRLTLAFDDGYADAVAYVASRAPKHPRIEWLVFVCPEKIAVQAGFRWDLYAWWRRHGLLGGESLRDFMSSGLDRTGENLRPALREVARQSAYRLASVAACLQLAKLPNVRLGNHTNTHFNLCALETSQAEQELRCSCEDFVALFGAPPEHFSFAFGSPGVHFTEAHADMLRHLGKPIMWSTEGHPYLPAHRRPGVVLPRFVFERSFSADAMVLWMALQALRFRLRESRLARSRRRSRVRGAGPPPLAAA